MTCKVIKRCIILLVVTITVARVIVLVCHFGKFTSGYGSISPSKLVLRVGEAIMRRLFQHELQHQWCQVNRELPNQDKSRLEHQVGRAGDQ